MHKLSAAVKSVVFTAAVYYLKSSVPELLYNTLKKIAILLKKAYTWNI